MPNKRDPKMTDLEAKFLRSAEQVANGQFSRVHTPEDILARRAVRSAGGGDVESQASSDPIHLDPEVVSAFQAAGRDWQVRINEILKEWLRTHQPG